MYTEHIKLTLTKGRSVLRIQDFVQLLTEKVIPDGGRITGSAAHNRSLLSRESDFAKFISA